MESTVCTKSEYKRTRRSFAQSLAPRGLHVSTVSFNGKTKHRSQPLSDADNHSKYSTFHDCSLARYPAHPRALEFASKRVCVAAWIDDVPVEDTSIDTASDVPYISARFVRKHPTLSRNEVLPVPPGAVNCRSSDGLPLKVFGLIAESSPQVKSPCLSKRSFSLH